MVADDVSFPGYNVVDVPHDGNCQFSAIAIQLGHAASASLETRREVVSYLRTHGVSTDVDMDVLVEQAGGFEEYLRTMAQCGTWGDGVTLAGAAAVYQRSINIVCSGGSKFSIDTLPQFQGIAAPLTLGYYGAQDLSHQCHYVSLVDAGSPASVINNGLTPPTNSSVTLNTQSSTREQLLMADSNDVCKMSKSNVTHKAESSHKHFQQDASKRETNVPQRKKTNTSATVAKRQVDYPWLVHAGDGGALCKTCVAFYASRPLPPDHSGIFVNKSFSNWKKSTGATEKNNKLLKHSRSQSHRSDCVLTTYCFSP